MSSTQHLLYSVIVAGLIAACIITAVMFSDVGGKAAFTWHPVLMSFSFLVFMAMGVNSYWTGSLNGVKRSTSRNQHAVYQIVAVLLAIGGWIAIFIAHSGKSHTGAGALRKSN